MTVFLLNLQAMEVTLLGDLTAHAQKLVEVESKLEAELAPILHHHTVEETAVGWDRVLKAESATSSNVQVRGSNTHS